MQDISFEKPSWGFLYGIVLREGDRLAGAIDWKRCFVVRIHQLTEDADGILDLSGDLGLRSPPLGGDPRLCPTLEVILNDERTTSRSQFLERITKIGGK